MNFSVDQILFKLANMPNSVNLCTVFLEVIRSFNFLSENFPIGRYVIVHFSDEVYLSKQLSFQ